MSEQTEWVVAWSVTGATTVKADNAGMATHAFTKLARGEVAQTGAILIVSVTPRHSTHGRWPQP